MAAYYYYYRCLCSVFMEPKTVYEAESALGPMDTCKSLKNKTFRNHNNRVYLYGCMFMKDDFRHGVGPIFQVSLASE